MLKAIIRHFKIDMLVLAGSEDEWRDQDEEGDVFATDDEGAQSPPPAAATEDEGGVQPPAADKGKVPRAIVVTDNDEEGDEEGNDPSF